MSSQMHLTIIVPIYNVAPYLDKCLGSILQQNLNNYEVIMVNDASEDEGGTIAKSWSEKFPQFKYIEHEHNRGLSAARNTALEHAQGEFVTFLDSDDYLEENTLSSCLSEIADADVIEYPIQKNCIDRKPVKWTPNSKTLSFEEWMKDNGFNHCYAVNKVYRLSLWNDVKFPIGLNFEDIRTIPQVLQKANKIKGCQKGTYYYCERAGSISNTMNTENLKDFTTALVELLSHPLNTHNHTLYIRALNAQTTYQRYGGKSQLVPRRHIPWSYFLEDGLNTRERIKFLWYKITRHA